MNWQKYTLDEWLIQFGAWCHQNLHQKTGNLPKIETSGIFALIEQRNSPKHKVCQISDLEAYHINLLLCDGKQILPFEVGLLIESKVNRKSFRLIAKQHQIRADKVFDLVNNAKYLLLGINPNLVLDCCNAN